MANNRLRLLFIAVAGFVMVGGLAFLLGPRSVSAAEAPNGIIISPFLQQLSIQPGETKKTFTITLTNRTTNVQNLDLRAQDFGSLDETGGVLLEGATAYSQKYGLGSWLTLSTNNVMLNPGESHSVLATIENKDSLQPGGHYGAIVATVSGLDPTSGNRVAIKQELTSLVLVNKVGGAKYDLKLKEVTHDGNWLNLPSTVHLRFQNPGNVHVVPRGVIKLKTPSGKVLAQGIINDESSYVLPESHRQLIVSLQPVAQAVPLPGTYHLEIEYRYDGLNRNVVKVLGVGFINLKLFIAVLLLLLGCFIWRRQLKLLVRRVVAISRARATGNKSKK